MGKVNIQMSIKAKLAEWILSKAINKWLASQKINSNVDLHIETLDIKEQNNGIQIHLEANCELDQDLKTVLLNLIESRVCK